MFVYITYVEGVGILVVKDSKVLTAYMTIVADINVRKYFFFV
jgi:uncharacterized membrane protein YkgB